MFKLHDIQLDGQEILSLLGAAVVFTSLIYFFVF